VRVFGRRQITALGEIYSADSSCRCACVKFGVRTRDLLQRRQSKALLWFSSFFFSPHRMTLLLPFFNLDWSPPIRGLEFDL
jgi:hypothetical protein